MQGSFFGNYFQWLTYKAGVKHLVIFLFLSFVMNVLMVGSLTPIMKEAGVIDMAGFYSVDTAYQILKKQRQEGRHRYLWIDSTLDIIYPVFYTSFYIIWIFLTWGNIFKSTTYIKFIYSLPIFAACCDYLENAGIIAMILNYPVRLEILGFATSIASAAKWVVFIILNIIQVLGTGLKLIKKSEKT